MKKKLSLILLAAVLVVTSAFMFACSSVKREKIYGDYDFTNPSLSDPYAPDAGVVLDGKLEEDIWQGNKWWNGSSSDGSRSNNAEVRGMFNECEVDVTSHFTDKGLYFGVKMYDDVINVYSEAGYNNTQKTGVTIYLSSEEATALHKQAYELVFAADGTVLTQWHYLGGYNKYPVQGVGVGISFENGNLNANGNGTADSYTLEIFIPWVSIGMEEKPEMVNAFFATIRHQDATETSQYGWENICSSFAGWSNPQTWLRFTETGLFEHAAPTQYTMDGDDADWADYNGEVKRVDLYDGIRYVEYKMIHGIDGLYIYAEALQRLYLTGENEWFRNTNIEINVTNKSGGGTMYYLDANQSMTKNTFGIMKSVDTTVNDAPYKLITAEYFIPDTLLKMQDIDQTAENLRVGLAFRNGKYNGGADETLDAENNEVTENSSIDGTHAGGKPYLFFAYGHSPYGADSRLYVNHDGVGLAAGIKPQYRTIDGKADDWEDYEGNEAIAFSLFNKYGFNTKAYWGTDGIYLYTVARHKKFDGMRDVQTWYSKLNMTTAIVKKDKSEITDGVYAINGKNYHFCINAAGYADDAGVGYVINDIKHAFRVTGSENNFITYVESFIPNSVLIDETFAPYFTDGAINDGYDLRLGFGWRTKGDNQRMFQYVAESDLGNGFAQVDYMFPMYRNPDFAGDGSRAADEYFYIDAPNSDINRGLRWTANVAEERAIDGDVSDWADYDEAAKAGKVFNKKLTVDADGRYSVYRGYFGTDGLYMSVEAKTNQVIIGNARWYIDTEIRKSQDYHWSALFSTVTQFSLRKAAGDNTNNSVYNVGYGYNSTLDRRLTLDGEFATSESAMTYKKQADGTYITVMELFIPNRVLYKVSGTEGVLPVTHNWYFGAEKLDMSKFPQNSNPADPNPYWDNKQNEEFGAFSGGDVTVCRKGNTWLGEIYEDNDTVTTFKQWAPVGFDGTNVTDNVPAGGLKYNQLLEVTVKVGKKTLTEGYDYDLSVTENEDGNNSYTVTGKGRYAGCSATKNYKLNMVNLGDDVVIDAPETVPFGDDFDESDITITYDGEALDPDYYDIVIGGTDSIGAKVITVTGKKTVKGEITKNFTIVAKDIANDVDATVGTVLKGNAPTNITVTYGDITLVKDTDYTVEYSNYAEAGMGVATITAIGDNYTGTLVAEFVVLNQPRSLADAGASVTATAYAYYEPDATSFLPETLVVKYNNGTTEFTLQKDVDYTLGNVSYNNTDGGTATLTINGIGLFQDSKDVEYTINHYRYFSGKNSDNLKVEYENATYTGEAITPTVTVTWDGTTLVADTDYTIEYADNTNAGTATITVTAKGNVYKESVEKTFTIAPRSIADATVTLNGADNLKLDGRRHDVSINSVALDGLTLIDNTDYTATHTDNLFDKNGTNYEGTFTLTGKGNYTGTAVKKYTYESHASHKRIDADNSDWADYQGNAAIAFGMNKGWGYGANDYGFEAWAKWENDGLYIYAIGRHQSFDGVKIATGPESHFTNLRVSTAVVKSDKSEAVKGSEIYLTASGIFTRIGGDGNRRTEALGAEIAFKTENKGATGWCNNQIYVSYVEAFIPNSVLIDDDIKSYFTDNVINDGYDLRLGFAWRTKGDGKVMAQFVDRNTGTTQSHWESDTWKPIYREMVLENVDVNKTKNDFFYIDKPTSAINRGLRWTATVAQERAIDGNTTDWADYDAAAENGSVFKKHLTVADGRYIKYRGYFGTDGLYVSVEAKVNKFAVGRRRWNSNAATHAKTQDYFDMWEFNTHMQLKLRQSSAGGENAVNESVYNVNYGYNSTLDTRKTLDNEFSTVESAVRYNKQSDGKYLVGMELFIPNRILYRVSGTEGTNPFPNQWIYGSAAIGDTNDGEHPSSTTWNHGVGDELFQNVIGQSSGTQNRWNPTWFGEIYEGPDVFKTWNPKAA